MFVGIDVGTGSVRAGIVDASGRMLGLGVEPIKILRSAEDFVEQSSEDIWRACGVAVRAALLQAGLDSSKILGIGFDATCSLVAIGERDEPVTVSPGGEDRWNVIVWMDHRATNEAKRINATGHEVLKYVGGSVSPEMQTPKLLWLKENMPSTWKRARRFLDLPDYLTYRATGVDIRSECTTTCKWTYLAHAGGWDPTFFRLVGLGDLVSEGFSRIGKDVGHVGDRAGALTDKAAQELGLAQGTPVAVSIIDAHAGGLGLVGIEYEHGHELEEKVALIAGTSTCHMAVTQDPKFVPGVWGPYFSAMVPGMWLTEGGQSASGALLDHTIFSHARGAELKEMARTRGTTVYTLLNERLDELARKEPFPAAVSRDVHVLPDHHGNRSPRADPSLRGMVSGLRMSDTMDSLAILYLATVQALALGTRHILDEMNAHGHKLKGIVATGGDAKNRVYLREHADATGCPVVLARESEAVLVGAAILGAVASGRFSSVVSAMKGMTAASKVIVPQKGAMAAYHDARYKVFRRMYEDQMAYRKLMGLT